MIILKQHLNLTIEEWFERFERFE